MYYNTLHAESMAFGASECSPGPVSSPSTQTDITVALAQAAHSHLQSAIKLRELIQSQSTDEAVLPLGHLNETISVLASYLRMDIALDRPSTNTNTFTGNTGPPQLRNLPRELVEQICAFLPPNSALALRRLSRTFNALLTSSYFARMSLAQHLGPVQTLDSHVVAPGASDLDKQFLHWPASFQRIYISRSLLNRQEIDWKLKGGVGVQIPSCIGDLVNLKSLDLGYSNLVGVIPRELMNLVQLESLKLHENVLEGAIPKEIGKLANLRVLNLHSNKLSGEIPVEIAACKSLTYLNFGFNRIQGQLPHEIGELVELRQIVLANNKLSGTIPAELGSLMNLQYLFLQNNDLMGEVPVEINNLANLVACELLRGNPRLTSSFWMAGFRV